MSALIQLPPKPRAIQPRIIPASYEEVAASIGFMPESGGLFAHQIRSFMAENGINVYNGDDVNAYMDALALAEEKDWVWRPLRPCDLLTAGWHIKGRVIRELSMEPVAKNRWLAWLTGYEHKETPALNGGANSRAIYDKPVPIEVLRDVKKLTDKFGEELKFFVSDYAVPNPDPFIMVTAQRGSDFPNIIFGVWDEPGFGT